MAKKIKVETIDYTPSWQSACEIYLAVLDNEKASEEGRKIAQDGLRHMARVAQMHVDSLNKKKS